MRKKNYTPTLLFEYYVRSQLVQDIDRKSFFFINVVVIYCSSLLSTEIQYTAKITRAKDCHICHISTKSHPIW